MKWIWRRFSKPALNTVLPSKSTPIRGASISTGAGAPRGLELGCLFSINPDAHSTEEIDNVQWGVLMARKGAVPKDRVLNTLSLAQFEAHLRQRKENQTKTKRRKAR